MKKNKKSAKPVKKTHGFSEEDPVLRGFELFFFRPYCKALRVLGLSGFSVGPGLWGLPLPRFQIARFAAACGYCGYV